MKGLLYKDFIMAMKYCRTYLVMCLLFLAAGVVGEENLFFVFYPSLLAGMVSVTLLAYDERSGFLQYCACLPCSRAQYVSAKYLAGLLLQAAMTLLTAIAQSVRMGIAGVLSLPALASILLMLITIASFSSGVMLPLMFKLGVEKGRIMYYVMIGIVCAGSAAATELFSADLSSGMGLGAAAIAALVACGLYALSWRLSIRFYEKRSL